jgi:hypothetical protein
MSLCKAARESWKAKSNQLKIRSLSQKRRELLWKHWDMSQELSLEVRELWWWGEVDMMLLSLVLTQHLKKLPQMRLIVR